MKRFFVSVFMGIFFGLGLSGISSISEAQEPALKRVYFRVKTEKVPTAFASYVHHQFGNNIFSLEAPEALIEDFKKNPLFEFRGEASVWKVLGRPEPHELMNLAETIKAAFPENFLSHNKIQASCSPTNKIPWGVSKVNGGAGGAGLRVGVVDTGVDTDHPDLKNNLVDCVDAQSPSLRKRCRDGHGHGTHVMGTIAANGKILGVAPEAKMMAIKVCSNRGTCWSDDVARGIRYAADNGANIINISLGGSSMTSDEKNQIDYAVSKGVLVVAAAGNSGPSDNSINYPSAYTKVVAVGATDPQDAIPSWSSRGNNYQTTAFKVEERDIEFAAPGSSVESTMNNDCYEIWSGTSMATPHVAGLAAKFWQGSALATREYLQERARYHYADIGRSGDDPEAGFGLPTAEGGGGVNGGGEPTPTETQPTPTPTPTLAPEPTPTPTPTPTPKPWWCEIWPWACE